MTYFKYTHLNAGILIKHHHQEQVIIACKLHIPFFHNHENIHHIDQRKIVGTNEKFSLDADCAERVLSPLPIYRSMTIWCSAEMLTVHICTIIITLLP